MSAIRLIQQHAMSLDEYSLFPTFGSTVEDLAPFSKVVWNVLTF